MKRATKIFLIIASSLVFVGFILFLCVMTGLKWDFSKLSTGKYETNTYEINGEFNDISMITTTSNIKFVLSNDGKTKVECYEEEKAKHFVTVSSGTLNIKMDNQKAWYDYIGFYFGSPKITVYLSKTNYNTLSITEETGNIEIPRDFTFNNTDISASTGNINFNASVNDMAKIKATTGNIDINSISIGSVDIKVSTGKVKLSNMICENNIVIKVTTGNVTLTNIKCNNLTSNGSTGNITLDNVNATNKLMLERSTGNVKLDKSDASEIFIKTSTGNVTGSLLSNKIFITDTSTGKVDVPKTIEGGKCEINTSTGNIKIRIA